MTPFLGAALIWVAMNDPRTWMRFYASAIERQDPAALAALIDPTRGVQAEIEDLVSMKSSGLRHRRDAAALLEEIGYVDLAPDQIHCDRAFAPDGTATCVAHPELFPSTYRWRRGERGVFLEYLREGDGVE